MSSEWKAKEEYRMAKLECERVNKAAHKEAVMQVKKDIKQQFDIFCRKYASYDIVVERTNSWICNEFEKLQGVNIYFGSVVVGGKTLSSESEYIIKTVSLESKTETYGGSVTGYTGSVTSWGSVQISEQRSPEYKETSYWVEYHNEYRRVCDSIRVKALKKGSAKSVVPKENALANNKQHFSAQKYKKHPNIYSIKKGTTLSYGFFFLVFILSALACSVLFPYTLDWGDGVWRGDVTESKNYSRFFFWFGLMDVEVGYSHTASIWQWVFYAICLILFIILTKMKSNYEGIFAWREILGWESSWVRSANHHQGEVVVWYDWGRWIAALVAFISLSVFMLSSLLIKFSFYPQLFSDGSLMESVQLILSVLFVVVLLWVLIAVDMALIVINAGFIVVALLSIIFDNTYRYTKESTDDYDQYITSGQYDYWEKELQFIKSYTVV